MKRQFSPVFDCTGESPKTKRPPPTALSETFHLKFKTYRKGTEVASTFWRLQTPFHLKARTPENKTFSLLLPLHTHFTLFSTFVNVNTYRQNNMTSVSSFVAYNLWPWLVDGASTLDIRKLDTNGATTLGILRWARWSPGTVSTVCWNQTEKWH